MKLNLKIYFPTYSLFTNVFTYLSTYFIYLLTYLLPTYINWFLKRLCHVAYFNYAKWQISITLNGNMKVGYILVTKMGIDCKLHTNEWNCICWPYTSLFRVWFNIIMNHHLRLDIKCNVIYVIKGFLIACVDYNSFIIANYNCCDV
jgi:hypothetical protein